MMMTHLCLYTKTHINTQRRAEKARLLLERVGGDWKATMATGSRMKVLVLRQCSEVKSTSCSFRELEFHS